MLGIAHFGLEKYHVAGHHSGASIAIEMAAVYPERVLSLTVIGPALLTPEEQATFIAKDVSVGPYNEPIMSGTHMQKTWDLLLTNGVWEVTDLQEQTLDALRAWKGRIQIYTCVFTQPVLEVFKSIKCPVLGLCAADDSLYPQFPRVKELVSISVLRNLQSALC